MRLTVRLTRPETAERHEELRAAADAHRTVLDLVQNPTPVTTTVEVTAS